jgi:hypothetical protein
LWGQVARTRRNLTADKRGLHGSEKPTPLVFNLGNSGNLFPIRVIGIHSWEGLLFTAAWDSRIQRGLIALMADIF